mgnify:CR=1 FL=1|tara:strand:+ start:577 stop:972 length:396 start_codon:yes stop_codon:yes gene_type:complete
MTTIAWDGKTLASDSQMSGGFIEQFTYKKIKTVDGMYYGMCGRAGDINSFFEGKEIPDDDTELLEISAKGQCVCIGKGNSRIPITGKTSIGSGSHFAMGAMLHGASAVEAVKIAIKLDPSSGGKVQSVKIK